jgi:hypothetical protein
MCRYMQVQRCKVQGVVVVLEVQRCMRCAVGGAGGAGDLGVGEVGEDIVADVYRFRYAGAEDQGAK